MILYYNTEMYTMFDEKKEFYFCVFCLQISLSSLHLYHREDFQEYFTGINTECMIFLPEHKF